MNSPIVAKIKHELENNIKGRKTYRGEDESYFYFLDGDDDIRVRKTDLACFIRKFNQESWNYCFELNR